MKTNRKSQLFSEYNRAKAAARREGSDMGRLNRGLGVAQKSQPRPYHTTVNDCNCPDRRFRGTVCKHMLSMRLQHEQAQPNEKPQSREDEILKELGF